MRTLSLLLAGCFVVFSTLVADTVSSPDLSLISSLAGEPSCPTTTLTSTSRSILRLFYITQHLNPALVFIKKMISQSEKTDEQCVYRLISFFSGTSIVKSEKMKTVLAHIIQAHSLAPLFRTWEHIKQFKYGINPEEKIILLDFSKLCLVTYQSLLATLNQKNSSSVPCISPEDLNSLEHIDEVFETMEHYSLLYSSRTLPQHIPFAASYADPDLNEFCASFALRYYLNSRLKTTFSTFTSFHKKRVPVFCQGIEYLGFKKEEIVFEDQVIAHYFNLLQEEKRLDPLMHLIGHFQSFDFIKNTLFIKEFLILLCIVYKDLLRHTGKEIRAAEALEELHTLSLEELLFLIDTINEKYINKKSPSSGAPHLKNFSISELIKNEYSVSALTFTNLIFHRYYYIKRLEGVVKILLKFTTQNSPKTAAKTSLLLKPLPMVWEDFIAYKEVCDPHLIDDFTKEIFMLSQTVLHNPLNESYTSMLQSLLSKKNSDLSKSLFKEQAILLNDFKPFIEVDKVISRFYFIKRLEPIMAKISTLNIHSLLHLGCTDVPSENDPCLQHLTIQKEPIITMIRHIYKTNHFGPLFSFWNGISRYKYIQDEEICSEFARFIIHLIHSTATHQAPTRCKEIFIEGKGLLPLDHLNEMPLEDILNLLDILVEELPVFLKENEIGTDTNWKEWIKKYWLIAPLRAVILGVSVYMMYKGMLTKPQHH
jgi:hypothetical protein